MTTKYRLAPGVKWVVDRLTVTVSDGTGHSWTLQYPEAAVWDLFSRPYAYDTVVSMMTHIASLDTRSADAMVRGAIEEWAQRGLLEPVESRVIEMRAV